MQKNIKEFTPEEYFKDYKFITNSHLLYFSRCPYFYQQKKNGNVIEIDKDYFTYGKSVDKILSKEKAEDIFFIGTAPTENVEELEECIKVIEGEMAERAKNGKTAASKKPLKTQTDKIEKFKQKIAIVGEVGNKIVITSTVFVDIMDTAMEIMSQPLYEAFINASSQNILAIEINGVKVKCMIDKLDVENKIINDDKTTAQMSTFGPDMYLQQLAWYRKIVREVYGITCDCYLSVGDKNKNKNLPFKRSSLYYATPARLDYQEELNEELLAEFLEARKKNEYPPCVASGGNEAREEICFKCDHYQFCKFSRQQAFIII